MNTLSICMIVKDEEELLPQCLDSIKDVADELIIVDTGSTDRTVEIAKKYTEHVHHFPWVDDFSAARNHSLKYATSDWVGYIDADEELKRQDIPIIRRAIQNRNANAIVVDILNKTKTGWSRHHSDRFFRNGTVEFAGRKHNQAMRTGAAGYIPITIYHYGYNLSPEKMAAKNRRDENLLKLQIEEFPDSTFIRRNLVRTYRVGGKYEEAVSLTQEILDMAQNGYELSNQSHQTMVVDTIASLNELGRYQDAIGQAKLLIMQFPANIDAHYFLASAYCETEEYTLAIETLGCYLDLMLEAKTNRTCAGVIVDTWGSETQALRKLGELHIRNDEPSEALDAYRTAMDMLKGEATFTFPDIADALIVSQAVKALDMGKYGKEFARFVNCLLDTKGVAMSGRRLRGKEGVAIT